MDIKSYNKDFFIELIKELNKESLKYCIIGDYQNLPESIGHDIDLWTNDVNTFRKILFESIRHTGHKVIIDNQTANGCNVAFYKREKYTIYLMKIDVMTDTSYKSILTLVDKNIMERNIIPYNNFYVANHESEAVMHFLYPMFEWGKIKKDTYKKDILNYYNSDIFKQTFNQLWEKNTTEKLLKLISEEKWDEIISCMNILKRRALIKGLFKWSTYKNILLAIYHTTRRYVKPSGKCLAFCGLDGAGKTTILDEMNDMFVNLLKSKKVFYGYWRPFVIPEIRELFGKKNSKEGIDQKCQKGMTIIEPEKKSKNKVLSIVKLLYYWLDFMLALKKYGNIRSRGGMVLFDRHYIDMIVHPQRFEMELPKNLILFMYKFIPKADYTFFLYCTPDEILKRKKEFTKDEIIQMTDDYMNVGRKIRNFIPIHTNTTVAEEIDEILAHIALK